MATNKYHKIKGTIYYAHIKEPDTKGEYASGKYKLDLSVGKETKKQLETLGVQVKNKGDEKGDYVTLKSTNQPTVIDPDGNKLTAAEIPLIGNGSKGIITIGLYDNRESNVKAGKGGPKCAGICEVVLTEFVSYDAQLLADD